MSLRGKREKTRLMLKAVHPRFAAFVQRHAARGYFGQDDAGGKFDTHRHVLERSSARVPYQSLVCRVRFKHRRDQFEARSGNGFGPAHWTKQEGMTKGKARQE